MASFQISVKPNRRAAARFVGRVRSALQEALVKDKERIGVTQSKIAEALGVHRSVISRELNGRQDLTLGRVAELAWAMGREIDFSLPIAVAEAGQNAPMAVAGAAGLKKSNVDSFLKYDTSGAYKSMDQLGGPFQNVRSSALETT